MATKVMLAPALARREATPAAEQGGTRPVVAETKPKRRRSSVYDADGNEVFITLMCLKCRRMQPLSQFGLRRMADGAIRNQPWCRGCRGGASAEDPARKRRRKNQDLATDPSVSGDSCDPQPSPAPVVDAGTLAAQVVAALQGGRR